MKLWPKVGRHIMTTVLAAIAALGVLMAHSALTAGGSPRSDNHAPVATNDSASTTDAASTAVPIAVDANAQDFAADAADKPSGETEKPLPVPSRFEVDHTILEYQAACAESREAQTLVALYREYSLQSDPHRTPIDLPGVPGVKVPSRKTNNNCPIWDETIERSKARIVTTKVLMEYSAQIRERRAQLSQQLSTANSDGMPRSEADYERMGILGSKREYDNLAARLRIIIEALNAETILDRGQFEPTPKAE